MVGALTGSALGAFFAARALALGTVSSLELGWSIPNGVFSIGLDPLSAYFLVPLFILAGVTAVYGHSYMMEFAATRSLGPSWAAFNLLVASMAVVIVARHAILFLVAWELMSVAAFLLVTFEHQDATVRRAGWVYLIATHIGVAFLIAMFLLLGRHAGGLGFAAMLEAPRPRTALATVLFLFGLIGFGAKAGLVPFHVWLPEAHAAAPSHVSALMSGILIKLGIYGILRLVVLLGGPVAWWGAVLIVVGLGGGALGIACAIYQRDIKRAFAYSSIENVGLVALGLGLGIGAAATGYPRIAAFGLIGALLHVWNHAAMKGLLFLGAGSVLHACHTKDLERLGGLGRRMPRTATLMLLGAIAIAGLPPLNGFVSEWLMYSGLLHGAIEGRGASGVAVMAAIAALSMIGAMAALCFIRIVGVAFLGAPRSAGADRARESPPGRIVPMTVLGLAVIGLALLPGALASPLDRVADQVLGDPAKHVAASSLGLDHLGFLNGGLLCILALGVLIVSAVRRFHIAGADDTWGCGYSAPSPRMQYGARGLSEFFTSALPARVAPRFTLQAPQGIFPKPARFESDTSDPLTRDAYEPFFARSANRFARLRWMQQGMLHVYILYIVLTLIAGLAWSAARFLWAGS